MSGGTSLMEDASRPLNSESLVTETALSESDVPSRNEPTSTSLEQERMGRETPPLIDETDKLPSAEDTASPSINPETYEDYSWSRLPLEVQEAATRLGYTKEIWDEDQEPESSNKDWTELHPEEQEAAKVLGYDEATWNSEEVEMTPKDYDPLSWKELPKHIQEAYSVLGYDEDLWDRDQSHATLEKNWDQLTRKEWRAAKKIGYTEQTWNEDDSSEKDNAEHQGEAKEESVSLKKYDDCPWEELPTEVKDAAQFLGYTEENWNGNKEPEVSNKYWEDLSKEQKEAAMILGYNDTLWNFGDKEVKPKDYDDMFWTQLPQKIKEAYEVLGYNEDLWDRDETPAAIGKDWDDLTEEEQNAAVTVGFTETTWDEDSEDEDDDFEPKSELNGFQREVVEFLTGSSYVLLDCISMAAFFGVIESIFLIGKLFLDDKAVNLLKIVSGLAIMQFNGQLRKWLGADKETKKARSRRRRGEITLFRSSLNVFSWWTTFAGVNHFFYSFEKDYLFKRAEEWFQDFYELAEKAFEEEVKSGSATGNMTCTYIQNFDFNQTIQGYLLGKACALSENEWEPMGHFYYCLAFFASAVPMWLLFGDNFLKGCDV